jgi:CBS domain containing-hemolysin-like protein
MAWLVFYVTTAVSVSFVCSLMEAVLLSVTPVYIAHLQEKNAGAAASYEKLKKDIDTPLAAILSLNTIAHTMGAAGAGAKATEIFGDAYFGAISAVLTLLILVLSEIVPKTLGAVFWKTLSVPVLHMLKITMFLMRPLVFFSGLITAVLPKNKDAGVISHNEFQILIREGIKNKVFDVRESEILTNLFRLRKLTVRDIMTPRTVMFAIREDSTVTETLEKYPEMVFSRIPVYKSDTDSITGFVLKSDILSCAVRGCGDSPLSELARPINAVPESVTISRHFSQMVKERWHISLVVDEYGGTAGIVTLEDIVETLMGTEILDESDQTTDLQRLARQQWRERIRKIGLNPDDYDFDD